MTNHINQLMLISYQKCKNKNRKQANKGKSNPAIALLPTTVYVTEMPKKQPDSWRKACTKRDTSLYPRVRRVGLFFVCVFAFVNFVHFN